MMNKEEAKQKLHDLAFPKFDTIPEKLNLVDVLSIVEQIELQAEEPLGVLMIYVDYGAGYNYLATDKANDSHKIGAADTGLEVVSDSKALKVTEAEAKEKYPSFKWVSLEELAVE